LAWPGWLCFLSPAARSGYGGRRADQKTPSRRMPANQPVGPNPNARRNNSRAEQLAEIDSAGDVAPNSLLATFSAESAVKSVFERKLHTKSRSVGATPRTDKFACFVVTDR